MPRPPNPNKCDGDTGCRHMSARVSAAGLGSGRPKCNKKPGSSVVIAVMSNWADEAEKPDGAEPELLPDVDVEEGFETEVGEDGVKTVVEYQKDPQTAERLKVTSKVKVIKKDERIKKCVLDRRTWAKFGDAAKPPQTKKKLPESWATNYQGVGFLQDGVTYVCTPFQELDMAPRKKAEAKKKPVVQEVKAVGVWKRKSDSAAGAGGIAAGAAPGRVSGAYVPPTMRAADGSRRMDLENIRMVRDDTAALRVSNLSDDVREDDLQELFRPFGPITRTYLAKDRETGFSRGFAFINFVRREDAQAAMDKLAGYGYDHLILQIEWAKPSAT